MGTTKSPEDLTLRRLCFVFTKRAIKLSGSDPEILRGVRLDPLDLLAGFISGFRQTSALKVAMQDIWQHSRKSISDFVEAAKASQLKEISAKPPVSGDNVAQSLNQVTTVVQELPEIGSIFMTGDDYLDALSSRYKMDSGGRDTTESHTVVETLFVCLRSLTRTEPPQTSLLLDQLYNLKTMCIDMPRIAKRSIDSSPGPTILSALLCSTSFLHHLKRFFTDPSVAHHARAQSILTTLETYQQNMSHLHSPPRRRARTSAKGKGRANGTTEDHEMHMHSMKQVSTLQELFPDLPPAYLLRLLDHFDNDVEATTAGLLEPSSLPSHLAGPNFEALQEPVQQPESVGAQPISVLPERRNVFDNDDFDNLRISSTQLHRGKASQQDIKSTAEESTSERAKHKAAILSALAAFDADDDERDDTYDVADVGGTVDSSIPGTDDAEALPAKKNPALELTKVDELLYQIWKTDSTSLARDTKTRLGQVRGQIKRDLSEATGQIWTDEMIEGWAVMLNRDVNRQKTFERKFGGATGGYTGGQTQIERTAWRSAPDDNTEGDSGSDGPARGGGYRGRGGRGRGRGGGSGQGGNVAGPSNEASTQAARRRKEQRGGGNHARREGRAKKVARGFGGPPP